MKVKKRKKTTQAYQWTKDTDVEVFQNVLNSICFATAYTQHGYGTEVTLVLDGVRDNKSDKWKDFYLQFGDWFLVRSDGKVWSLTEAQFNEKYEEDK